MEPLGNTGPSASDPRSGSVSYTAVTQEEGLRRQILQRVNVVHTLRARTPPREWNATVVIGSGEGRTEIWNRDIGSEPGNLLRFKSASRGIPSSGRRRLHCALSR